MKKLFMVSMLVLAVILVASSVFAQTVAIDPFIFGARSDWGEVAEVENVNSDSRITACNFGFFNVGAEDWNKGIWVWGTPGYVQTAFTAASDSLFVNFEADWNDGLANFYIDNALVYSLNTYHPTGNWFSVVFTGLTNTNHTLRVEAPTYADLAIEAMGSGAPTTTNNNGTSAVPEPITMLLFGPALLGLVGLKKKRA